MKTSSNCKFTLAKNEWHWIECLFLVVQWQGLQSDPNHINIVFFSPSFGWTPSLHYITSGGILFLGIFSDFKLTKMVIVSYLDQFCSESGANSGVSRSGIYSKLQHVWHVKVHQVRFMNTSYAFAGIFRIFKKNA